MGRKGVNVSKTCVSRNRLVEVDCLTRRMDTTLEKKTQIKTCVGGKTQCA